MAIQLIDNNDYRGKKPNFERDSFKTLAAMKAYPETDIDEGHLSHCLEDGEKYVYKSGHALDEKTGRWRKWQPGSGPGTGEGSAPSDTPPENPAEGSVYFNTARMQTEYYIGGRWVDCHGNAADAKHSGTTAEHPTGVQLGFIYWNTDDRQFQMWNGKDWVSLTYLSVDIAELDFGNEGGEKTLRVTTNTEWNVVTDG